MDNPQSLADLLNSEDPPRNGLGVEPPKLEDISDPKDFATAVLESRAFRVYIVAGLTMGTLQSAIVTRLMDYGWGKPPDRVEHTGKDGKPIEMVTEVRRVIVRAEDRLEKPESTSKYATH